MTNRRPRRTKQTPSGRGNNLKGKTRTSILAWRGKSKFAMLLLAKKSKKQKLTAGKTVPDADNATTADFNRGSVNERKLRAGTAVVYWIIYGQRTRTIGSKSGPAPCNLHSAGMDKNSQWGNPAAHCTRGPVSANAEFGKCAPNNNTHSFLEPSSPGSLS